MKIKTNSLIILFLTVISFLAHADDNQKTEFKKSEQAIKTAYSNLYSLLNDKGKKNLQKDQEEWLQKRKELISSYANYSTSEANRQIIEVNWNRANALKSLRAEIQKKSAHPPKKEPNELPPDVKKKLSSIMLLLDEGQSLANQLKTEEALGKFEEAKKLAKVYFGEESVVLSRIYQNIAEAHGWKGNYSLSIENYEKALDLSIKSLGPENPNAAEILQGLASEYNGLAQRGKALESLLKAKNITEKHYGGKDHRMAGILRDIGYTVFAMGDYNDSYLYAEQAEKIAQPYSETIPALVSGIKVMMATILSQLGFYDLAIKSCEEAIRLNEKSTKPNISFYDGSMSALANAYELQGNFTAALEIQYKILKLQQEDSSANPKFIPNTQRAIAMLHHKMGNHQKAIDILLPLASSNSTLNKARLVLTLDSLGQFYYGLGNFPESLKHLENALKLGREINGPTHPITIATLENISVISTRMGNESKARSTATQWVSALEDRRESVFYLSEGERLLWVKQNFNFSTPIQCLKKHQVADIILRWKGIVLDSILEDRAIYKTLSDTESGPKIVEEIQEKKNQIAVILAEENFDRKKFEELQRSVELMESSTANQAMADGRARSFSLVTHEQIVERISKDSVVVDFVLYYDRIKEKEFYAASIITADGTADLAILEDAEKIGGLVEVYRRSIDSKDSNGLRVALKQLHDAVWKPIREKIPEETKVAFLGTEGMLNFISFATLLDEQNNFLCNKIETRYIGTGRDLLRGNEAPKPKNVTIFADPDFSSELPLSKAVAMRSLDFQNAAEIELTPLPGSRQEAQIVSQLANQSGLSTEIQIGEMANEGKLMKIESPSILHLATHGFFVGSSEPQNASRGMKVVSNKEKPSGMFNPMRQGAVTLAGAQKTLKKWNSGEYPDPSNDGILTAEEAAGMNLDETWLVVLSSCDSGAGFIHSGEGVYGLRRGFMIAGAQNILMTLWPVDDKFTPIFMQDFYKEVFQTGSPAKALGKVQREWINKINTEQGLASAVGLAGPFVLAVTGSNH
jgi:CHAT domain-containing protein